MISWLWSRPLSLGVRSQWVTVPEGATSAVGKWSWLQHFRLHSFRCTVLDEGVSILCTVCSHWQSVSWATCKRWSVLICSLLLYYSTSEDPPVLAGRDKIRWNWSVSGTDSREDPFQFFPKSSTLRDQHFKARRVQHHKNVKRLLFLRGCQRPVFLSLVSPRSSSSRGLEICPEKTSVDLDEEKLRMRQVH